MGFFYSARDTVSIDNARAVYLVRQEPGPEQLCACYILHAHSSNLSILGWCMSLRVLARVRSHLKALQRGEKCQLTAIISRSPSDEDPLLGVHAVLSTCAPVRGLVVPSRICGQCPNGAGHRGRCEQRRRESRIPAQQGRHRSSRTWTTRYAASIHHYVIMRSHYAVCTLVRFVVRRVVHLPCSGAAAPGHGTTYRPSQQSHTHPNVNNNTRNHLMPCSVCPDRLRAACAVHNSCAEELLAASGAARSPARLHARACSQDWLGAGVLCSARYILHSHRQRCGAGAVVSARSVQRMATHARE